MAYERPWLGRRMEPKMAVVTIVGLGPGPVDQMTRAAEARLLEASQVFFRISAYPAYRWLESLGKEVACFDHLYTLNWPEADQMYEFMVTALLKQAKLRGHVAYALPGSPWILEDTTYKLIERRVSQEVEIEIIEGMSFLEPALAKIGRRFDGLQIVLPRMHLESGRFDRRLPLLVCQIEARSRPIDPPNLELTIQWLLNAYPPDHEVTLIWTSGLPEHRTRDLRVPLGDLAAAYDCGHLFASLFVPPAGTQGRPPD
jgi:tetrapyrrole methylase family protein/MazG family protein